MSDAAMPDTPPPPVSKPGLLRRWLKRFVVVGVTAAILWNLPQFLASTPLRKDLLTFGKAELPPGVQVGRVSLDWLKPIELHDISISTESGRRLVQVDSVRSEKSLWELAIEPLQRGLFHVRGVTMTVVVREGNAYFDPTLRRLLSSRPTSSGKSLNVALTEARVRVVDENWQLLSELSSITAELELGRTSDGGGSVRASGVVSRGGISSGGGVVSPGAAGRIDVVGDWQRFVKAGKFRITATGFPLDVLGPSLKPYLGERRLTGHLTASANAHWTRAEETGLDASASLEIPHVDICVTDAEGTPPREWRTDDATAALEFQMPIKGDVIEVETFTFSGGGLDVSAEGRVFEPRGAGIVDLTGRITYELAQVTELLEPDVQSHVAVEGLKTRSIRLHGPLFAPDETAWAAHLDSNSETGAAMDDVPPALELQADIGWDAAVFFGIESHDGLIAASLRQGELTLRPEQVAVSGGHLRSGPTLQLRATPLTARLDRGVLLENVQFSESMCRTWLKYLSPLLADATGIDGRFTLSIDEAEFPVREAGAGQASGTLLVHTADVGPGPLAKSAVGLVAQVQAIVRPGDAARDGNSRWIHIEDQQVPFRLVDGRMHHEDLHLQIGDAEVVSHGSVGVADDSLDLWLELAIPDQWLRRGALAAALRGEVIRVRVRGTLSRPQVDARPLAEFGKRLAVKAPVNLLLDLLDRRERRRAGE